MTRYIKILMRYVYEEFDINRINIQMSIKNKKSRAIPVLDLNKKLSLEVMKVYKGILE
ncbi:hypothetical protein PYL43_03995 [Staphylococcus epidermidis]|nr:hypothetical protein [Staphylococcus epidermidis]